MFSEFGRTLAENASQGTDHGTAGPVLLLGKLVKPGLLGTAPDLAKLVDGEPVATLDYRRIYATVLEKWVGCAAAPVLGKNVTPFPFLTV